MSEGTTGRSLVQLIDHLRAGDDVTVALSDGKFIDFQKRVVLKDVKNLKSEAFDNFPRSCQDPYTVSENAAPSAGDVVSYFPHKYCIAWKMSEFENIPNSSLCQWLQVYFRG